MAENSTNEIGGKTGWKKLLWLACALIVAAAVFLAAVALIRKPAPPIQVALDDGRILQIEGVTYGTTHRKGRDSVLERFSPWLPRGLAKTLGMNRRETRIEMNRPGLVVWVSAIDAATKTNVDFQGIRVEFLDKNGELFGEETHSWFGGQRAGHEFYCYPRDERELTLRVTTWDKGGTSSTKILNPHVTQPANWSGNPLPQSKTIRDIELVLSGLDIRTNGQGKKSYYETAARFFEPRWDCRQNGNTAVGWEKPEWIAEDAIGNRGQFLGLHQPALKFFATVFPKATNLNAAQLIASLPSTDLTMLTTNVWWNKKVSTDSKEIVVLGLFLRGTHTFCEGEYESSSPAVLGPGGGSPSGWTGQGQQINPLRKKVTHSHYTPTPVIYVRAPKLSEPGHLAVRLRDDHGQYWVAKPEENYGDKWTQGIHPFLLELPSGVTNVAPEVVFLKPVQAEFLVDTKNYLKP